MQTKANASRVHSVIPSWFAAPTLATPERTRRAYALWVISWPFFAVVSIVLSIAVAVEPATLARRAVTITLVGLLITGLHALNRRGRTSLAGWMLVIGLTLIVTQRAWVTGGIHAPVAVFYTLFILMAGALLGARAAIVTAFVCLGGATFLTVAETTGWLVAPAGSRPAAPSFVFVVLTIGLALVLQHFIAWAASGARSQRDDFVRMVVHDFKSPIAALQAQLTMLRDDAPAVAARVDEAIDGAKTLERMTNTLLDVGRFEAGTMTANRALTNVSNLVRDAVRSLAPLAPDRYIDVFDESTVVWPCDAELIRRVIENLVTNAIRHTPPTGAIRVRITPNDERIVITVQDEGPGIPAEARERIFAKFSTEGPLQSMHGYQSTGLGLAFCKVAAEAHGGTIRVIDAVPRGSVFILELPA